ncbi:unnamed protein product [Pelagomonas calceolata]|uniref:STAS domain-containing protein n=2 Tax=Pelagomonas calceolata TaxID=35677 RepID=A0A8J2S574_9STRA|nr:unnamed protein product [Pelagomonas calceolata]
MRSFLVHAVLFGLGTSLRMPRGLLLRRPSNAPTATRAAAVAEISRDEDLVANAPELLFTPLGPRKALNPLSPESATKNALSGFAVSLAMIPEAVAFAFVAGVSPIVGLQTTAVLGFVAAAFGGRGGITTGASGACAVVVAGLVASHGASYLSAAVALAGLIQVSLGVLGAGKFIRLVPHPVMLGFVNGLAVVMTRAQLRHFRAPLACGLASPEALAMVGLTSLTMGLVRLVPRLTRAVPPTLAAVSLVSVLSSVLKLPATTLADLAGKEAFAGGLKVLPSFKVPAAFSALKTAPAAFLKVVLPYAATMACVGLVESLLTLQLVDGIADDGNRGSTRQECIGQGLGNLASGLTGGQGGCALIGQSLINVEAGGTSRLSGMVMAGGLAAGLVSAAPLLGRIPIAALVGVMLLVCKQTFSWSSLRLINKIPKVDLFTIALVSTVTVTKDLAQAVFYGVVASALGFAWKQSTRIKATSSVPTGGWKTYAVDGPLFFGSTSTFSNQFDPKSDPNDVIIDFKSSRVVDHSALESINELARKYGDLSKKVHLRGLSSDCYQLLERLNGASTDYELMEPSSEDPIYEVAEDYSKYGTISVPRKDAAPPAEPEE